jgi:hypothetical protein
MPGGSRNLVCGKSWNLNGPVKFFFSLFGFQFNICGAMPACGTVAGKPAYGCEAETQIEDIKDLRPQRPVGMERSLQLSAEGFLTLTYKGSSPSDRGELRVTWTYAYLPPLLFTCTSSSSEVGVDCPSLGAKEGMSLFIYYLFISLFFSSCFFLFKKLVIWFLM